MNAGNNNAHTNLFLLGLIFICLGFSTSCNKTWNFAGNGENQIFTLKKPSRTGIDFRNDLEETTDLNIITYEDFYSGGGVGIGDINNDGLSDVIMTGNMVQFKLYLNQENLKFKDITEQTGLKVRGNAWYTGVAMADVNADGYLDFYISKSGLHAPDDRQNLLYINNGDLTFSEQGKPWGIIMLVMQ